MASPLGKWLAHVKRVRFPAVSTRPQRSFTLVTGNESCGNPPFPAIPKNRGLPQTPPQTSPALTPPPYRRVCRESDFARP